MSRLKDKVSIITGAAAGIGEATAIRFAEEGARLLLNDRDEAGGRAALAKVRDLGAQAVFAAGDISKEDDARALAAAAMAQFGQIDILVNNAADFTTRSVEDAEVADWQRVLGVNVIGTATVSRYVIPHMKERRRGAIVNVGSISAFVAQPGFATYNASKGAQLTMTRCMALDLAPFGIRVNTVCPGCILTSASFREMERNGETLEQWLAKVKPMHMLNRVGDPREVANAVLFLASDEAGFITAADLMVDGGYIWQ